MGFLQTLQKATRILQDRYLRCCNKTVENKLCGGYSTQLFIERRCSWTNKNRGAETGWKPTARHLLTLEFHMKLQQS